MSVVSSDFLNLVCWVVHHVKNVAADAVTLNGLIANKRDACVLSGQC